MSVFTLTARAKCRNTNERLPAFSATNYNRNYNPIPITRPSSARREYRRGRLGERSCVATDFRERAVHCRLDSITPSELGW
jgi:hypothetical protein